MVSHNFSEISNKSIIRRLSSRAHSSNASDSEDDCREPDVDGNDSPLEAAYPVSLTRLLKINSPEWFYILIGCIAAVFVGASFPTFAILFGEFYGVNLQLENTNEIK